jgi:glutamate--cysteine ligase
VPDEEMTPVAGERDRRQEPLPSVEFARAQVADRALCPSTLGTVGLELEGHLVDRRDLRRRVSWTEVMRLVDLVEDLPRGSRISVEPGGQLELSTKPAADLGGAVAALRDDERALRQLLREEGYGLAFVGLDPLRPGELVNPAPRYAAMTRYFDRFGCGTAGRLIMASSAGLQLNLEAGPREKWEQRLGRISRLGPLLGAMSACSPIAAGQSSGWSSMRQQGWSAIDPARTAPVTFGGDPAVAWADYALSAPVMMIRVEAELADPSAATKHPPGGIDDPPPGLSFSDWVRRPDRVGRPPTTSDLEYHLTTLFPPIRPRGYLELRFLDAVPMTLWPGLAAIVGTLCDHPTASDRAAELIEPLALSWHHAAKVGLDDPELHRVAVACADVAVDHCPNDLRADTVAYAELLTASRTPGDHLRSAAGGDGRRLLEEALDA